ncbi:MAG: hypothetical protein DME66_02550 [Verrucomicrobia bacterium]|nr:MAG: hypothetical protein DME66_02550 [Verrucomicrobiota bacterium]
MKQSFLWLAVGAFFLGSVTVCRAEEAASGRWEGSVRIPARELKLVVDLAQDSRGSWSGSIIIPELNLKGALLTEIAVQDSSASFAIKTARGLQAAFKGSLNADGTLAGSFVEAGNTAPFVLKKTGPPQVETPPQSTPISKELEGEWKGEYEMYGYPRYVTVKLVNRDAEGAAAEFVIVGRKTNNLSVDLVTQEGDLLTIDSHEIGISYEGRFEKATHEIKGTFIQGAIELPLVLRRAQ